ncbi:kinase-like domain-containing protein, partial [Coemansia mojavensis]
TVGNFIIDKTLAEKPGTKVCLARHKKTKKNLALKFIKLEGQPEKRLIRYQREVNNLALLHHPHIAKLLDAVQTERFAMLVCEYAVRGDLLNYSREQGRMNEEEARRIFRQLVSAVDYLHKNCIVHRKITMETVLLDNDRNVKLVGFGRSNNFQWNRLLDTYCGAPFFCSPEMVQGVEYTGPEADIWSMGVILYFVLSGTTPFKGEMLHDVYESISKGKYDELENSSQHVRDLLARIFVVDRSKRITMQEIIDHEWTN